MTESFERDRERMHDLPEHESDADVADRAGGGILGSGGTAIDRGTGTTGGVAQGVDADVEADSGLFDAEDATPGITDFTEVDEADRSPRSERGPAWREDAG